MVFLKSNSVYSSLSLIGVILLLYIYLFNPVFVFPGFGLNNIMLLVAGVYCLLNKEVFLRELSMYRVELFFALLAVLYFMIMSFISDSVYINGVSSLFGLFSTLLFLPIFLVNVVFKRFNDIGFFFFFFFVGLMAACISVFSLIFPAFNSFIRGIQTDIEMEGVDKLGLESLRSFGLGGNLTSAYGYIMGIFASICLLIMVETRQWIYGLYILFFLAAAMINARTGILVFVIALLYVFANSIRRFSIKNIAFIGLIVLIAVSAFLYLQTVNSEMFDYLYSFVEFFITLNDFEDSAYSRMLIFPDTLQGFIWGEGLDVFGGDAGEGSDIGYVRNIFFGGLFFLLLIVAEQFVLFKNMYIRSGRAPFVLMMALSVMIFHYKGCLCYGVNAVSRFLMLYYFLLSYNITHSEEEEIVELR